MATLEIQRKDRDLRIRRPMDSKDGYEVIATLEVSDAEAALLMGDQVQRQHALSIFVWVYEGGYVGSQVSTGNKLVAALTPRIAEAARAAARTSEVMA